MLRILILLPLLAVAACSRADTGPSEPILKIELANAEPADAAFHGCWEANADDRLIEMCIDLMDGPVKISLATPGESTAKIALTQGGFSGQTIHVGTPLGAVRFFGELQQDGQIVGTYFQGVQSRELIFERSNETVDAAASSQ
jgi:hypothetical protein